MIKVPFLPSDKKLFKVASILVIMGVIFSAGLMLGAGLTPTQLIKKLHSKLVGARDKELSEISSIFFPIALSYQDIPMQRNGNGGGLTSYKEKVLLLTHEGRFFSSTRKGAPELLSIEPPGNNIDAYEALAEDGEYFIKASYLRYNDILYYEMEKESGLIVSYTEFNPENRCYNSALAKLVLNATKLEPSSWNVRSTDWNVFYRTSPCMELKRQWRAIEGHNAGGRLDWLGNGKVVFASGDYGLDGIYGNPVVAQNPNNGYGKIIEVDVVNGNHRVLSIGHRNTQGIVTDDKGNIWVTEHGARGGDELNFIREGGNYGWPLETLGTLYSMEPVPNIRSYGRHLEFTAPIYSWVPSVGLSNITQITNFHSSWDGDLLASSLKMSTLYRLRMRDRRVVFAEPIVIPGKRIRYVHQHIDGVIVMWTDTHQLIYMSVSKPNYTAQKTAIIVDKMDLEDKERRKLVAVIESCTECHSFDSNNNQSAPNLGNVFNRKIGKSNYNHYTKNFLERNASWDEKKLALFLKNPSNFIKGTSMPSPNINDERVIKNMVQFLKDYTETIEL